MKTPFTLEQFIQLLRDYNSAIWPIQIPACALGLGCIIALVLKRPQSGRFVFWALAAFWIGIGLGFHLFFFRQINPAAPVFAGLFVIQGLVFIGLAIAHKGGATVSSASSVMGWLTIFYAAAGYPALNLIFGHTYPAMPIFGVTPCPTTIFTFGALMLVPVRGWALIGPVLWAIVATSAALSLGMREDFGLTIAAVLAILVRLRFASTAKTPQALAR